MIKEEFQHSAITALIIGAAMKVHRTLGPGFREVIYSRALCIELRKLGLKCEAEVPKEVYYNNEMIGKKRLDLLVDDKILVELKARSGLEEKDYMQTVNYLNVFRLDIGLLLNFGAKSLFFKRFANSRNNEQNLSNQRNHK